MKNHALRSTAVSLSLICLTSLASAAVAPLPSHRNIDIEVANDNGAIYGAGADDTYYINAPGGGLNQLHISTDGTTSGLSGQVTARSIDSSSASGTFWVTTTGGRGYNDDIILLFSLQGPIHDDFSLSVKSSGYQWTPSTSGVVNPAYTAGAVDEVFGKGDFLYGPQTAKPGPGTGWVLPFYSGQDIGDPATAQHLMFVDLYVGNHSDRSSIDSGSAKVEFEVSGLYENTASFNAYAWALSANIADSSINWTNRLSTNLADIGQSGYSITSSAVAPIPEPEQALLFVAGLATVVWFGRTSKQRRPPVV